ncbi:MAG: hypothetical protein ABI946_04080 [Chthoniobacterales bacterium]
MTGFVPRLFIPLAALWLVSAPPLPAQEDVAEMEEIIVEEPFDVRLQLPKDSSVQIMIERMRLRLENERAEELKIANRNTVTRVLDLTEYSPIKFGAALKPGDDFRFLDNYMRADLNPRNDDPLSLRR